MTVANSPWTRYLGYLRRLSAGHLSERRPRTTRLQRMRNLLTFRTCKVPSTSCMHCWRAEARRESTGICLRCWSYCVSLVCSASPTTSRRRVSRCLAVSDARRRLLRALLHGGGVLPALQQSPTRDAALFQLFPSPVDACGLL